MSYFPFFVNVEKLQGIIIGGGSVALEKVERLLASGAALTVIARSVCPEIREYKNNLEIIVDEYKEAYLDKADYVIAATDNQELNEQIYKDSRKRKLLVNVVDVPELCDFIFPSVVNRGKLVVGVSTSGAGPQIAIRLRKEIEKIVPDDIEEILDYMAQERIRVKNEIEDPAERRRYLIELADRLFNHEEI